MKKSLLRLISVVLILSGASAMADVPVHIDRTRNYETVSVCIWENKPQMQMIFPTCGVKIGILGCFGAPVYGAEGAVVCAGSDEVYRFKGGLGYTLGKRLDGMCLAPVNVVDEVNGLQIGAVNVTKGGQTIQVGLLNFLENGFLPVFPLVNFSL